MSNDFDWSKNDSVVVPTMEGVAVYTDQDGDIVVRQQNIMGDEDAVVIISRGSAAKIAKAIQAEAKKPFTPD